ncbi:unnamed protein product [Ophioblennius macclurei]
MEEMSSSTRTQVSLESSGQQPATNHNIDTELTSAWKSLAQSKAALRHIENRIEAAPGTGVCLDSIISSPKKKSSKAVSGRDGRQVDAHAGLSKTRCRSQQSPEKSSSRSPLRNTTQDSNVRRNNSVEFREPLASYSEATPPPHPAPQPEAYSLKSAPGSLYPSFPLSSHPSQLVYQRDTRDKQTDRDLDSTHSSALESTEVRYLNDQPALDSLRTEESTPKAQLNMENHEPSLCATQTPTSARQGESTPSSSPGSASQRLENLRRHQPDDRLEKLKERIRRQRQHLEEAAEKEKLLGYLERPINAFVESSNGGTSNMPTAKIRKVATAPPAPIYKGFSRTETKIRSPDRKVWKEEDFHNLSREIYRDLSQQFAETTRTKHSHKEQKADRSKERRHPKPVRKVHRAPPAADLQPKLVISPASWREGQKLVKMVLGSGPKLPREKAAHCADERSSRTDPPASRHRSDSSSQTKRRPRPNSTERPQSKTSGQFKSHQATSSARLPAAQDKAPAEVSTDLLSADIQGILDDLQLQCKEAEEEERARKRSRSDSNGRRGRGGSGSQTRTPVSTWGRVGASANSSRGCRSASPTTSRSATGTAADIGHKKRHYDADTVRQYIARQQEERKRRQAEEKRALREETEKRNQRLKELYRRQREVAKSEAPVALVQKQLQETYSRLLIEEAQLGEETARTYDAASSSYMRPMYQPSGESDKENKRLEAPQSPSSSDQSLNDQPPPPLSRNALDAGVASLLQADRLCPAARPVTGSGSSSARGTTDDHLLSHLLRLEKAAGNIKHTERAAASSFSSPQSKGSRIEALKATAASLSNRIESEARKLAGDGMNCGLASSVDVDIHPPRATDFNDDCWAQTVSRSTGNTDMALRIQRILTSTGHSSHDDMGLPGTGNLHAFREEMEKNVSYVRPTSPRASSANRLGTVLNSSSHEKRDLLNGLAKVERTVAQNKQNGKKENLTDLHDSSGGSISEGPLLSEGSFSEDDASRRSPFNGGSPRTANHLEAVDHHTSQRKDYQRLLEFQSDAASCLPFAQHNSSKTGWEELNKGSPLSVINIFTKNLCGPVKVSERNSPPAQSEQSDYARGGAAVYEDDFVSSHSGRTSAQLKRGSNSPSVNSHFEELMRRSPYEKSAGGIYSQHSSFPSSAHSPHYSSGSTSGSSPHSRHSARKKGTASDHSDATLVEERSSGSPPSESSHSRKKGSSKTSINTPATSVHTHDALEQNQQGPRMTFTPDDPHTSSPPAGESQREHVRSSSQGASSSPADASSHGFKTGTRSTGKLQYSPAVLHQRMAAEFQYLESIEDSVRQLGDMERLVGVSMAQQESASLAQMLKAKQQRHERDLYELKIKAEREALEAELQLEENRQKVARAHIELQESLAATQRETLEGLQESTTKMMSQQAEAARYTVDAARHIKELAEMARSQIPPAVADSSTLDQQQSSHLNQQQDKADSDSFQSEVSSRRARSEEAPSSLNSLSPSDSLSFKRPELSGATSGSHHSTSHVSSDYIEEAKEEVPNRKWRNGDGERRPEKEAASSSVEEEVAAAANDSLCTDSNLSALDEKGDSTSVATEYSLKFDESMTEDEIEERSFRSLLPSEAHRRGTMEKKSHHHELQEASVAFSGGQDSFSQFTMDMVRQYMKDEEVRLQHQSSLLHLRQKALKDKTRTELAWLEHQKKRLRDKGEDDKMPPIRKKQRGLLIKLQQEQAEIKRLQEANKAARKERQMLMKQQEEIERMRNSTLRLKERLKCAGGEASSETPVSELAGSEAASPNIRHPGDTRSPSPSLSISGSETSSIMQKLKKMHSHMDEKFLTKREQQLIQRRHHAEELLQWKQRLDQEEAEVRRMEKEALAAWDQKRSEDKDRETSETPRKEASDVSSQHSHLQSSEIRTDSEKEYATEGECSSVPESSIHGEGLTSPPASVSKSPLASNQSSDPNYSQDFTSASQSPSRQSSLKGTHRPATSPPDGSNKTKMQLRSASQTPSDGYNQSADPAKSKQLETISNQSDIESRIKALKEEVKKRKFMAYRLKKEQKKRNDRLKAQEASLLKQLQNYNNFIVKTKAELDKEPEAAADTISQIESTFSQEPSLNHSSPRRSETSKIAESERTLIGASLDRSALPKRNYSKSTSVPEDLSNEALQTSTVAEHGGKETPTAAQGRHQSTDLFSRTSSKEPKSKSVNDDVSDHKSDVLEELETERNSKIDDEHSEPLLKLQRDSSLNSQSDASKHASSHIVDEEGDGSEKDMQIKQRETSEGEEPFKSKSLASYQPYSVALDTTTPTHRSSSPSSGDSRSAHSTARPSNKETPTNNIEALPTADGYHDDFESSVDSSPREDHRSSLQAESKASSSPPDVKGSPTSRATTYDSQDEVIEEDIPEEPSERSHQSERLLDLDKQAKDFSLSNEHFSHSPPQTPTSPRADEMPGFTIGDRVLVGGVQPGTLRFKGPTSFANGFWAGVELDKSEGSNNGTYDGVVYFQCEESHGIFAPPDKITHLPDKFELYTDTTEDEDSFFDDLSGKGGERPKTDDDNSQKQSNHETEDDNTPFLDKKTAGKSQKDQSQLKTTSFNSQNHKESKHSGTNGNAIDILLEFKDASHPILISDLENNEITALTEKVDFTPVEPTANLRDGILRKEKDIVLVDTFADKLVNTFLNDTLMQFAEIKKAKEQKIAAQNQENGHLFGESADEGEWIPSVDQKDGLPFFLPADKEELSSPELCNRPESPVLGAVGQEELAKRLAELELSRELLDELGDDQDWFDEDFGLSSRREQQRLKQEEEEARLAGGLGRSGSSAVAMGGMGSSGLEQQVKTPPRPELPLPMPPKLPEQPAMVVPHSAAEVEKMVHAASREIWEQCELGTEGALNLAQMPNPQASRQYLGKQPDVQDPEALSIHSYRKAVYDLTWEILRDIYSEDASTDQPQWFKLRRAKSSSFHRVKTPGDLSKIQEFITAEVLKLYGLAKDQSQKTDWQKMLKFGRKKRDRVDHILVQELHEEEAQWVNYDEDELFVKMQLADSIFDALLKDTADVLTSISDKRVKRDAPS